MAELSRLILDYRNGEIIVRCLYRGDGRSNPGTKARQREVTALVRTGLEQALEALEGRVDVVGVSGFTTREDILSVASSAALETAWQVKEAEGRAVELEQGRQGTRDKDLDEHASALRSGAEVPSSATEYEAALDREIAGAIRTRDALQRATEGALADVASYRLKHASALQEDIGAALDAKAQDLAEHARTAAALFSEVEDGRAEARRLVPREAAPENTGGPKDTTVLLGPVTTRSVSDMPRGQVEAVLSYLASMGSETVVAGDDES